MGLGAEIDGDLASAFATEVGRICEAAGGSRQSDAHQVFWEIETQAGPLHVSPQIHGPAPWIACRFLQPARAAQVVAEINSLTGKWDFRLWADWKRNGSPNWNPARSTGLGYFQARLHALTTNGPPVLSRRPALAAEIA